MGKLGLKCRISSVCSLCVTPADFLTKGRERDRQIPISESLAIKRSCTTKPWYIALPATLNANNRFNQTMRKYQKKWLFQTEPGCVYMFNSNLSLFRAYIYIGYIHLLDYAGSIPDKAVPNAHRKPSRLLTVTYIAMNQRKILNHVVLARQRQMQTRSSRAISPTHGLWRLHRGRWPRGAWCFEVCKVLLRYRPIDGSWTSVELIGMERPWIKSKCKTVFPNLHMRIFTRCMSTCVGYCVWCEDQINRKTFQASGRL